MTRIEDSSQTITQQPAWAPSGKCDGSPFQANDGSEPRAKKLHKHWLHGAWVQFKHSPEVQSWLSPKNQKKSTRYARAMANRAVAVEAVGGGQADGTRRKSFSGSSAGPHLEGGMEGGRVSFDDDHDVHDVPVNDGNDVFDERLVDGPDGKSGSSSTGFLKTIKWKFSGRFSLHSAHGRPIIKEVGTPDGRSEKECAKERKKIEKAVGKKARKLVDCLGDAFAEAVKKEKVQRNSAWRRSYRKARETVSQATEFAQNMLDPWTNGGVTAMTGGKSIVTVFTDRMSAFINTCEDAGLPTNEQMYVQPLRDALKSSDLYNLRRIRFYAKEPGFRQKAKAMYSNSGSDSTDSTDSSTSSDRKREVEILLNNLDQAATERMKFLLQQAPVGALFNAGLLIQMHSENYKALLPVIADSFVHLYKGYRCGLHHPGETEQAYIARVIEEHAPEWMQLPIRIALGADPGSASCSQAEVADTIAKSMLGANKPPIAALLAVGRLLKAQALSSRDRVASRALAETLRASDAGIQKENVARAVGEIIEAVRHVVSVAQSEAPVDAEDARYALGKLFFDNLSRIAAVEGDGAGDGKAGAALGSMGSAGTGDAPGVPGVPAIAATQPQAVSASAVVPFDAQAVQSSLARIADVSKAAASSALQVSQVAQAAPTGPQGAGGDGAPDAATEQTLKMLMSPFPTWGQIPDRSGEMLVYHRGGVVRRVAREVWFHVKSAFKSGRALQTARALRRHMNVTTGVHRVVHNLFLPEDAKTTFRKLDVETRALISSIKQLARSEGEDYAWAYVRGEMEVALATGRRGQLQDAGTLLFGEPVRPLVFSGKQRRRWTRAWNYVIGKFFEMPSDSTVLDQAMNVRTAAADSLNKVVVNIMLRDVLAKVVEARRDQRPVGTFDAFKSLMEAYAASGGGKDFETWLVPAAQLLNAKDVKWMMDELGKHSISNGGYMMEFFRSDLPQVKLLVDRQEYLVYEDFAEALYRAFTKVHADKARLGVGTSGSSDVGAEGGQTSGQTGSQLGSQPSSQPGSQSGSEPSGAGNPVLAIAGGAIGHTDKAELMFEAGKMILPQVVPTPMRETAI